MENINIEVRLVLCSDLLYLTQQLHNRHRSMMQLSLLQTFYYRFIFFVEKLKLIYLQSKGPPEQTSQNSFDHLIYNKNIDASHGRYKVKKLKIQTIDFDYIDVAYLSANSSNINFDLNKTASFMPTNLEEELRFDTTLPYGEKTVLIKAKKMLSNKSNQFSHKKLNTK